MTRVRRSFWVLVAVAVLATGTLTRALTAAPSPLTGLAVLGSALVLMVAVGLATRVLFALERTRRSIPPPPDHRTGT